MLNPKSTGAEAFGEVGPDEAGEEDLHGHDLPKDSEYMENGDSSGEEEEGAKSSKSQKNDLGLDEEYMWTGSNFDE